MRWHRIEAGWYTTAVGDLRVDVVNVAGSGPRAPRWQGETFIWHVFVGGKPWRRGNDPVAGTRQTTAHRAESFVAAKDWVALHGHELTQPEGRG